MVNQDIETQSHINLFKVPVCLTVILGLLPFALYALARITGSLPTQEQWYSSGTNHGPWRWELQGFAIGYPMVLLAIATGILVLVYSLKKRNAWPILWGLGLMVIQLGVGYGQLVQLIWVID